MPNILEHKKFSLTNLGVNSNKFWNVTLFDNDDVHSQWGRQGDGQKGGQQKTWNNVGKSFMEKKIREKEKKGYRENKTIESSGSISTSTLSNHKLKDIAVKQIKSSCKLVQDLVDFLVKVNAHNILIATKGQIVFDTSTAQFKTTQGIVVPEQVDRARQLLTDLSDFVVDKNYDDYDFEDKLNEYLSLIPRDFGRKRIEPRNILPNLSVIQKENDILDSLDASFAGAIKTPKKKTKKKDDTPSVFNVEMKLVEDKKVIKSISDKINNTRKRGHVCNHLKLSKIYEVNVKVMNDFFENDGKKVGNIKSLYHGSRSSNILSILRQGLVIPPSHSSHCTGRLLGNGCYFASSSTKSLNYSYGYWDGTKNNRCFMFITDVALGKSYTPKSLYGQFPKPKYDSIWAKAGITGFLKNDEFVVYRTSQSNFRYLLEFE